MVTYLKPTKPTIKMSWPNSSAIGSTKWPAQRSYPSPRTWTCAPTSKVNLNPQELPIKQSQHQEELLWKRKAFPNHLNHVQFKESFTLRSCASELHILCGQFIELCKYKLKLTTKVEQNWYIWVLCDSTFLMKFLSDQLLEKIKIQLEENQNNFGQI